MARRCDDVFSSGSFNSMKFQRKYKSFIKDIEEAIEDSDSTLTRLAELMAIHEFAVQRMEAGEEESESDGEESPREQTEEEPIETKSRLERRFKRIRHLKEDGGMAEVYLAQDNETGDNVIWKQARPRQKDHTFHSQSGNRQRGRNASVS